MSSGGAGAHRPVGRGTVGGAFPELVADRADAVAEVAGRRPEIAGVLRRSEGDFDEILAGVRHRRRADRRHRPRARLRPALAQAGKHVVTANKQLIAQHGDELFEAARQAGVQLRFEAAVAGVVPVIRVIQESLAATEITKVFGIVNGTTNFILTEMAKTGAGFDEVLARAQELGYAEADPTDDVGGADAAAKMAILARLAFGTPVGLDDVAYEGITDIQPDDLAYAKELGLSLKLLGVAERRDGGVSVRVFPCFLYAGHPLAPIEGPFNAVMVEAPAITEITMSGPGRRRDRDGDGRAGRRRLDPRRGGAGARRPASRSRSSATSPRRSTSTSRWPTAPASSPRSPTCSARTGSRFGAWSSGEPARRRGS